MAPKMDLVCFTLQVRTEQVPHQCNYSLGQQSDWGDRVGSQSTSLVVMSGEA